jgi:chorismate synthase
MRFDFSTAGESHGPGEVALVHGVPAGLGLVAGDINRDLARRQRGYGRGGRQKIETDEVEFLGGVRHGYTWGPRSRCSSATRTTLTGRPG